MGTVQMDKPRRKAKVIIKPSVIAIYASLFLLIVALVSIGYYEPQNNSEVSNATTVNPLNEPEQTSVDNLVATNVAAGVAQVANLPIVASVNNMAVSVQAKSDFVQTEGINTAKPQIIAAISENRLVNIYTVVAGDTVNSLATKFNISAQTIKWANNLTIDSLTAGNTLKILPINGVLYNVKADDTTSSIANKYAVDETRLIVYNDLEVSGLKPNTSIILPNGILPETERPGYVAPVIYSNIAYGYSGGAVVYLNIKDYRNIYAMSAEIKALLPGVDDLGDSSEGNPMNGWYEGQCTWWAWERRLALGRPLPSASLGNGGYWHYSLANYGYKVDRNVEAGAIFEQPGHVGIVERINYNEDGSIASFSTSEMNYPYVTFNVVSRTIPASNISDFFYIH